ncbi:MAG: hypothetical protein ACT4OM_09530 [Actinomycetota bacterium]
MDPLQQLLQALCEEDSELYLAEELPPRQDHWFVLSDILSAPEILQGWVADLLAGEAKGRRDVAGSYLSSWLTGIVVDAPAKALVVERRAWPLEARSIALHRHADGWFDKMALCSRELWVLEDDPAADHPDSVVFGSLAELQARLAGQIVSLVEPIFASVRAATRYPTRSMWGALADGIAGSALWHDRRSGADLPSTWNDAAMFLDGLQNKARLLKTRPHLAEVAWSGGVARFSVKGTCCLYFKIFDGEPDPCGDGYCGSCPFRSETNRIERWAEWLEEQAVQGS